MSKIVRVAISQHAPEYLNLQGCLSKAGKIISEAASRQCALVVFGETWLCGYPVWLDYAPKAALWDHPATKKVFASMHENSIAVPGAEVTYLQEQARDLGIALCMGINEKVLKGPGQGTLYNSIITINSKGELVNHHRKLMPTFTEKILYGLGDARGLQATDMGGWTLGGLICWEHWMPLSRQAMHNQGEQIHIALWPKVHEMHQVASRHYAFEGRCFVLAAGQITAREQLPDEIELPPELAQDKNGLLLNGGSCIIGPDGYYLASPLFDKEQLIIADLDLNVIKEEQMTLDVTGHYHRPDIFDFNVKR